MSKFYTSSIADQNYWLPDQDEPTMGGNAWSKEITEGEGFINPAYIPLDQAGRKEGQTPTVPTYSEKINLIPTSQDIAESQEIADLSYNVDSSTNVVATGGGNTQEFVNQTNSKGQPILDWGNLKESWGAMDLAGKAGVVAGVAGHLSTLVSILDGSWAESQKKIIGHGKYHGPGRTWRKYA